MSLEKKVIEKDKEIQRLGKIINVFSKRSKCYDVPIKTKNNTIRFAVVSDTHIGSLYERLDALNSFYKLLKHEGIKTVLHCGDVLEGHKLYRGQEFEVYTVGFEKQLKALVEKYPKIKGIETYFITGTHDLSFMYQSGLNVGEAIEKARPDLHFLDNEIANIKMKIGKKYVVYQLLHPSGGTPYAVSYRSQKVVESFSGGMKPRAVFIGHLHKADFMPCFRNVKAFLAGCWQSQTPFMAKKPTPSHIGGWILEDTVGDGLTDRMKAEFVTFYEPESYRKIKS